jgi:hypothetical protein
LTARTRLGVLGQGDLTPLAVFTSRDTCGFVRISFIKRNFVLIDRARFISDCCNWEKRRSALDPPNALN